MGCHLAEHAEQFRLVGIDRQRLVDDGPGVIFVAQGNQRAGNACHRTGVPGVDFQGGLSGRDGLPALGVELAEAE
jgi:hypothetical protein